MKLLKQLRNKLAKELGKTAASIAANSVDHCSPEAKRAIEKTVEAKAKKLLDPNDKANPLPTDPNEPLVFRSDINERPFHIEVKGLSDAWQNYQENKDLGKALKDSIEIRAEWTMKF
ncbi:MAG: hypothetical protein KKB51_10545 [Candidatus Riflebacteria bacterium]|nr:hypothetical protein [Candidatus Riflebacteria bacterium]